MFCLDLTREGHFCMTAPQLKVEMLPFRTSFRGTTGIDENFRAQTVLVAENACEMRNSFRGRSLRGAKVTPHEKMIGAVLLIPEAVDASLGGAVSSTRDGVQCIGTFDSFNVWEHDRNPHHNLTHTIPRVFPALAYAVHRELDVEE